MEDMVKHKFKDMNDDNLRSGGIKPIANYPRLKDQIQRIIDNNGNSRS